MLLHLKSIQLYSWIVFCVVVFYPRCYFSDYTGCKSLNLGSGDFMTKSKMECESDMTVKCNVSCKAGYHAVFQDFLKLQCDNTKWLRKNNVGKYVALANPNAPPRCYSELIQTFLLFSLLYACIPLLMRITDATEELRLFLNIFFIFESLCVIMS